MAWTTPVTHSTGYVVLATDYNNQLINNLLYLHGDSGAVLLNAGGATYTFTEVDSVQVKAIQGVGAAGLQQLVSGDTQPRLAGVNTATGGQVSFGSGSATVDAHVVRSAAGALKVLNVKRAVKLSATYGATVTPDASAGEWQIITVTNGTAFTIANPTNPPSSTETQDLTLEISNQSGGAMGAITWGSAYVPLSAGQPINYTNPASTKKRSVFLRWSGAQWVVINSNSVDY